MDLVEYAKCFIGRPYIWGGDGSGKNAGGFDCSGLVVECLQAFGVVKGDFIAQALYKHLLSIGWVKVPRNLVNAADVLFWGKSETAVTHVSLAASGWQHVEAGGGGSKCKKAEISTGMVRLRPIASRKDFVAALRAPK